ncbi:MAG TPA: ornithine carbamoyltransferase [Candidatus Nanoarchaeia archaeon]|nr:ornithine carbamoyltransferase [Candidatus Nanoarchaeia archaeon]
MKTRHLLSIADLSKGEIIKLLKLAAAVKKHPKEYHRALYEKVLLTFFQMPSLRTEVSFDVAMFTMGGEVVDYHSETSPWAKGKESIEDVAKVISRYVDAVMVRMHDHKDLLKLAKNCSVPVINGLTSYEHPCQVLSDMQTIQEKFGKLSGLRLAYFGDGLNNVTHSLLLACAILGMHISVACPAGRDYMPDPKVVKQAKQLARKYNKASIQIEVIHDPIKAAKDADIVYTDSWMSYRIPPEEKPKRMKIFKPFQVTPRIMHKARKHAVFMHDLPGLRGMEVTSSVMDSKQSIIYDQAENRLHMEKAILLHLLR